MQFQVTRPAPFGVVSLLACIPELLVSWEVSTGLSVRDCGASPKVVGAGVLASVPDILPVSPVAGMQNVLEGRGSGCPVRAARQGQGADIQIYERLITLQRLLEGFDAVGDAHVGHTATGRTHRWIAESLMVLVEQGAPHVTWISTFSL